MRVGTVCYATTQGLGYLAKSFYDAGIITDVMVFRHPGSSRITQMGWYPKDTIELVKRPFRGREVERFLDHIDVMLFFETPFDWSFLKTCRLRGIPTVLIPMYEWYPKNPPHTFDSMISPSLLDKKYFPDSTFLFLPVNPTKWKQRDIASRFLHNGGYLGCREHKGTRQLLEAVPYLNSDLQLTVRSQHPALQRIVRDVFKGKEKEYPNLKIEIGQIPYDSLWEGYDVLVAPEKFNGASLPLSEARAAGMLVITTDRYPTNTWLPKEPLIPVTNERKARTTRGHLEFVESLVDPKDIAATMNKWHSRDITNYSLAGKKWAEENSWEVLKPLYLAELERVLCLSC